MFYSINHIGSLQKAPDSLILAGGPTVQTHKFRLVNRALSIKPTLQAYMTFCVLFGTGLILIIVNGLQYFNEWQSDYLWLIALGIIVLTVSYFFSRYLYTVVIDLSNLKIDTYRHLFISKKLPNELLTQPIIGFQVLKKEISKGREKVVVAVYEVNLILSNYSRLLLFHIRVSNRADTIIEKFKTITHLPQL